jgi:hypothetical protein
MDYESARRSVEQTCWLKSLMSSSCFAEHITYGGEVHQISCVSSHFPASFPSCEYSEKHLYWQLVHNVSRVPIWAYLLDLRHPYNAVSPRIFTTAAALDFPRCSPRLAARFNGTKNCIFFMLSSPSRHSRVY